MTASTRGETSFAPKVSIIMPVYNVENYLRPCIESALAQTLQEIEVIIVDDGSTDSSPDIIDYYARQDSRVVAIHKANEGYGKACNTGFDTAKGEYLAILESDDYVEHDMYELLYNKARQFDADVVKCPYTDVFLKDEKRPYPHNDYLTRNMPRNRPYSIAECPCQLATHQSIWAGVYRTEYMRANNIRFEEVAGAGHVDIKFCVESLIQSKRIVWLDTPLYNYRVEREGSSTADYRISENANRYREMHDYFLAYDKELFRVVAPSLVARECHGLYRYFKQCSYSDEDVALMRGLLDDFTDQEIQRAPLLRAADKRELIAFKNGEILPKRKDAVSTEKLQQPKKKRAAINRQDIALLAIVSLLVLLLAVELFSIGLIDRGVLILICLAGCLVLLGVVMIGALKIMRKLLH